VPAALLLPLGCAALAAWDAWRMGIRPRHVGHRPAKA
jgi:hypothetical protein